MQAFVDRLPSLQDLAAHHASADHSIPEQGAGSGEAFRDGMEADERACEYRTCWRAWAWDGLRSLDCQPVVSMLMLCGVGGRARCARTLREPSAAASYA